MKINLVSHDNGVGLTADVELLTAALGGHDVQFVEWTEREMRACDVAFFLELWSATLARHARATVGLFNLEWFNRQWRADLSRLSALWAKSHEAYYTYQRLGLKTARYTGFMSRDLHDGDVPRSMTCLHVRGKSNLKGTPRVLEAWAHNPDLPPLRIVSATPLDVPPGVTVLGRLSPIELVREMNAAAIHICPSAAEGWAHYIVEGLSVGAIVITTDASPMREHITEGGGFLLPVTNRAPYGLVTLNDVSAADLAHAVRAAAAMSEAERAAMGERARQHFHARNAAFREIANQAIGALC